MKNNRLQFLLKLLVDNEINKQELEELAELLSETNDEQAIDTQFKNTWNNVDAPTEMDSGVYQQIIAHPRFSSANDTTKSISVKQNRLKAWYYYAAAVLLICCGIGLSIYLAKFNNGSVKDVSVHNYAQKSVKTSVNQTHVTLKLSNGKELILDEAKFGKIVTEDQVSIIKNKDGQLVYDLSKVVDNGELAYNTITTPVGSNYQVVLSDGTKVWLNAKSSLKFPAVFKGTERKVELSGEAYFEVAHNKKQPFVLSAKQMTVQATRYTF
ncbi:FecR family protein [Pedobacter sp. SL55]|uniref:FecR family protein n=1 Tax=Pedobacter sp. SL55 TaxID=2995161 RepID=UPI00226E1A4E|nr:FecR family protein [Pedobacter sp. SL55]WAC40072.1 FecR family protein [Pedobacter sp. SL55]